MVLKLEDLAIPVAPTISDEDEKRAQNALFYSEQLGVSTDTAYDLEPELNVEIFGREKLPLAPGRMFFDAFKQSLADKPAMMLRGTTAYTPGRAFGIDPLLDKTSLFIQSLKDPEVTKRVQTAAQGKLWPIGEERRWWQLEAKYVPEVINAWAANVGDQIPIMLTTVAGRMAGEVLGKVIGLAAGVGAAAVTAGPDPSDVATAPAAVAVTQEVVKHLGGAAPLVAMEAGAFLDDAADLEIDADIAEKYARLYGLGSGAIEYAQQLWVLGRYSKLSKPAQEGVLKQVLSHIGGAAFEGVEEISQGGLENFLLQKAVAEMKERHPNYKGVAPKIGEGWKRNGAIGAGVAGITGLPGTGMSIGKGQLARMQRLKPETKKFLGEPSTEEFKQAAEKQVPIKQPPEVPVKPPREPSKAVTAPEPTITPEVAEGEAPAAEKAKPAKPATPEEVETPEEAREAETRLETEAAELIKPNLYIGNLTEGMKRRIEEGTGLSAKEMKGFTEKGFPTKRTAVPVTRREAEIALNELEQSLTDDLENNRIRTEDELALANAQWGNIAELRRALGLEKGTRPFTVQRAEKHKSIWKETGEIIKAWRKVKKLQEAYNKAIRADNVVRIAEAERELLQAETVYVAMEKALGHSIKVVRAKAAIMEAIRPTEESKMTVGQVLKVVMKRTARTAKMAYAAGRRELRAEMRTKVRAKKRIDTALKILNQKLSKKIDFHYREAIEALRMDMDLKHRSRREKATIASRREFLKRATEEQRKDIPTKQIQQALAKPLDDFTVEQLEETAEAVNRLVEQGKKKLELREAPEKEYVKETREDLEKVTRATGKHKTQEGLASVAKGNKIQTVFDKIKVWTWIPQNLFRMLDGNVRALWYEVFYDQVKDARAEFKRRRLARRHAGTLKMKELGLSMWELSGNRRVGEESIPVQKLIGIYMASKNPLSKLILRYGHKMSDTDIKTAIDALTDEERQFADYLLEDYDNNYDRLRRSTIQQENRDLRKEKNYSPIRRIGQVFKTAEDEINAMIEMRQLLHSHNVAHGFTLKRQFVPAEMQTLMRLDAVNLWTQQVEVQERYVNMGPQVRRMNSILASKALAQAVESSFGEPVLKMLREYVKAVANPYVYRQFTVPENISARLRRNMAIAYLGFNLVTMGKQLPSVLLYLPDAGPSHLLASAIDFATNPMKMIRMVRSLDPEVADRSLEREIEEMKAMPGSNIFMQRLGKYSMEGIFLFDTVARTIGWNAVYQQALADNKSKAEAIRLARDSTLRTQPAAMAEDIPQLYRTNEILNWFTMFTNQLNKIYNIATYDMPSYLRNEQYGEFALQIFGMSMVALTIWVVTNRKLPEEPADFAEAMMEQAINMMPILGKTIMAERKGWESNIPVFKIMEGMYVGGESLYELELSRNDSKRIAEAVALSVGVPYTVIRRGVQAVEEEQPAALIGERRPSVTKGRKATKRKTVARK